MKKKVKKLKLHRETLRTLSNRQLGNVAGGFTNNPRVTACQSNADVCYTDGCTQYPACELSDTCGCGTREISCAC